MRVKVLHHTRQAPFHTEFRGTEVYIYNHLKNSKHDVDIISRKQDMEESDKHMIESMINATNKKSQIFFMPYELETKIHEYSTAIGGKNDKEFVTIRGHRGRVKSFKDALTKMRQRKAFNDDTKNMDYINFLNNELKKYDKIVLAYHEMDSEDLHTILSVKKTFGDKVKVVGHLHCLSEYYSMADEHKPHDRELFKHLLENNYFDRLVAVSEEVKKDFIVKFPEIANYVSIVHGAVDQNIYSKKSKNNKDKLKDSLFDKKKVDYVVSYSGRLSDAKGQTVLLNLLKLYNISNPYNVGFVFAVPPEDKQTKKFINEIINYAPDLVRDGKVVFCFDAAKYCHGLSPEQISSLKQHYAHKINNPKFTVIDTPVQSLCDIYIHPSSSESLSLSVVEAIKTGVPIVASNIRGLNQYLTSNDGIMIDLGEEYIQHSMKYSGEKNIDNTPTISVSGKSIKAPTKIAYDFRHGINELLEKIKSGEISNHHNSIGKFSNNMIRRFHNRFNLEHTVNDLDRIYDA